MHFTKETVDESDDFLHLKCRLSCSGKPENPVRILSVGVALTNWKWKTSLVLTRQLILNDFYFLILISCHKKLIELKTKDHNELTYLI